MRRLSASEMLDLWEQARDRPPAEQALCLACAACPEVPYDSATDWPVGRRDSVVLALREATFGSSLTTLAVCPGCGERLELALSTDDIRAAPQEAKDAYCVSAEGYDVRFRLPNSRDLMEIAEADGNAGGARAALLERCVLSIEREGTPVNLTDVAENVLDDVVRRLGELDPQADIQLALSCPACGKNWLAPLDIVSFFWREVEAWAGRTLGEIHELARAYGWSEAEILSMSAWRRQCYLELIRR